MSLEGVSILRALLLSECISINFIYLSVVGKARFNILIFMLKYKCDCSEGSKEGFSNRTNSLTGVYRKFRPEYCYLSPTIPYN